MITIQILPTTQVPVEVSSAALVPVGINAVEPVTASVQPYNVVTNPLYDGAYTVTPATTAQTLDTNGRRCNLDIEVAAIPTSEVPNNYGTTFSIGS